MGERVIVVGCPGAGKSTFSRILQARTGLPLYHLDLLWHKPDRSTFTREEFDSALNDILRQDRWIIDGNYRRTLELRLRRCDTVFFLDLPVEECLAGIQARIGTRRDDLPWVEDELDEEFRQWVLDFPRLERPALCALLEKYAPGRTVQVFHSRGECGRYLDSLQIKA